MKAQELRNRFDTITQFKDDVPGEHLHGFPPRTAEDKRLSELFCIVSDIIIYLEDQEQSRALLDAKAVTT
jgi:hypothetical protein